MADDKSGREKQANDENRRQHEREILIALERGDETEPPVAAAELDEFETVLDTVSFPATGAKIIAAVGDQSVDSAEGTHTVAALVPETEEVEYDAPEAVRIRAQRPTIAAAMKRVIEASATVPNVSLGTSQREAYEKTFRSLKAIDADDDDEGIEVVSDWIVEQIQDREKLPGSRRVRKRAAKFCRSSGYTVRDGEWLGA